MVSEPFLQSAGAVLAFGLVLMLVSLALVYWVYRDARTHSDQPAFLWALVVFFAPLLGLVLYFLLGRNRRESRPPRDHSGGSSSGSNRGPPL